MKRLIISLIWKSITIGIIKLATDKDRGNIIRSKIKEADGGIRRKTSDEE